tara:strand:- start:28 stop:357 length:330 start_codon:yes stop_codon:yes gene_type:complete
MGKKCRFVSETVSDNGVLRSEVSSSDRVFKHAGVSNEDQENPIVATLAYSDGPGTELNPVESIEVEPDGEFYFNPEDYEFDISPNGFAEIHVSAPGGGKVNLSMMTCNP